MNWDKKDMSDEGIFYRLRMKAPEPKFTIDQEKLFVGWIIYQDLTLRSSTTEKFRECVFLKSFFTLIFVLHYTMKFNLIV